MVNFIDSHRDEYGVEPICHILPIAPSTYHRHKDLVRHPEKRSKRSQRNEYLSHEIQRVWQESYRNYGAHKVWKQLHRESIPVARCTVERLMKSLGISGVRRGKRCITTIPSEQADRPLDLVQRQFTADRPNQLWVADITYGAPNLRRLSRMILSKLEHVWNAFRELHDRKNWMPAFCYEEA